MIQVGQPKYDATIVGFGFPVPHAGGLHCRSMGLRHVDRGTATVLEERIATVVSDGVDLVPTGRCDMGLARTGKIGYAYGQETAEVKTHMDGR